MLFYPPLGIQRGPDERVGGVYYGETNRVA